MGIITFGFITSFFVVLLATPSLIKVAKLKHLVDEPGEERKLHRRSVPTIGGIIIFGAVLFSYALWYPDNYDHIPKSFETFKYLTASLIMLFFVGVKDDIIGTAPVKKLVAHMLVGFILVIMGELRVESMQGIFGVGVLEEWQSVFLSVFIYIVIVNSVNLIDGVDGLAAGIGFIIALTLGAFFLLADNIPLALLAGILAGALLGFLIFNFSPAKIFMGDSGSLVIGAIISVLAISAINQDLSNMPSFLRDVSKPVFVMGVMVYPLIDTLRIFIVRAIKGQSPFSADKNHIHHRLIRLGMSHAKTVLILYGYNFLVIGSTLLLVFENKTINFIIAFVFAFSLIQIPFLIKPKDN